MKALNESIDPFLQAVKTPTLAQTGEKDEVDSLLRKHSAMLLEWNTISKEASTLHEELKEDKWLTVFRTVTEQADGMMSSIEKAINRCQVCCHSFRRWWMKTE